jgi:hypothetical protein
MRIIILVAGNAATTLATLQTRILIMICVADERTALFGITTGTIVAFLTEILVTIDARAYELSLLLNALLA